MAFLRSPVELRMIISGFVSSLSYYWDKRTKLPRRRWNGSLLGLSLALVTYTYFVAIGQLAIAVALVINLARPAWMTLGEALWLSACLHPR